MFLNTYFPWYSGMLCKNKKFDKYDNDIEFQNTFFNLLNIAMYSFSFDGLPDGCNERYFKLNIILHGYAALINDNELGYMTLGCTPDAQKMNVYGEWPSINAYGWNGFNKQYKCYMEGAENNDVEAILCRDNELAYPMVYAIYMYAKRLTDTMRTLDVTAKKLKTPYFITCDESQKTSIKKILDDIDFNKDSIIANRSTAPNEFNVLQTGVNPQSVVVLWQHYSNLQSEIRTLLGINNAANLDKKERLVVDEAQANDILTDINIEYRLKSYQKFCDTANELFGLNISVKSNISEVEQAAAEQASDPTLTREGDSDEN